MKLQITKSKPIAKALIIKSKGSMPLKGLMGSDDPMGSLISSLMGGSTMPKVPTMMGMLGGHGHKDTDPEYDDKRMVMHALSSMRAIIDELESRACGCEPMPSWAEAKIYAAQKDILTVLGALMGREG